MELDELNLYYIKDYIRKNYITRDKFLITFCEVKDDNIHVYFDDNPHHIIIKLNDYNIYLRNDKIKKLKEKLNVIK